MAINNTYDLRRYPTEDEAFEHADDLKGYGVWPGVVRYKDGKFGLTYSPVRQLLAANSLPRKAY